MCVCRGGGGGGGGAEVGIYSFYNNFYEIHFNGNEKENPGKIYQTRALATCILFNHNFQLVLCSRHSDTDIFPKGKCN